MMPIVDQQIFDAVPDLVRGEHVSASADPAEIVNLEARCGEKVATWALSITGPAVERVVEELDAVSFEVLGRLIPKAIYQQSFGLIHYLSGDDSALDLSREHRETLVNGMREGIPIHAGMVRGMRIIESRWRNAFVQVIVGQFEADVAARLLNEVDRAISRYFDTQLDQTTNIHAEESALLAEGRAVNRRQLVDRMIAGESVESRAVMHTLGIDVEATHVGLVIWMDDAVSRATAGYPGITGLLSRAFAPWKTVTVSLQQNTMWMWVSAPRIRQKDVVVRIEKCIASAPGLNFALGVPESGPKGFRATHLKAQAAKRYGVRRPDAERIFPFEDSALQSLLISDTEVAEWFVMAEIGPLLGGGQIQRDLRETLRVLARHRGGVMETAEELYIHRNTVAYRMKRVQELLGRDPLKRPLETQAALAIESLLDFGD
ncbi:PucR family transcriptional regulator [Arthrobacter sp. KNU40]|uniref:PucR family transcriptional regulator n=1 Tax=Arthrobacter sp. KNU40 TaxID=3447965 RepID=UPI003F605532